MLWNHPSRPQQCNAYIYHWKIYEKLTLQPDYKSTDIVKDMKADFDVEIRY